MSFFANAKLVLGSVFSVVAGIFIFVFKQRGKEIAEQKEEIESLEREKKFKEVIDSISKDINKNYIAKENEIEEKYEAKRADLLEDLNDKYLSPTLLGKLRKSQGLPADSTKHTE